MARDDERQSRKDEAARDASERKRGKDAARHTEPHGSDGRADDLPSPRTGDASFANQNIFNTERGQTADRRNRSTLDEIGEPTTAALPDRTPRAPVGREDPADRQNVGTYEEQREAAEENERRE